MKRLVALLVALLASGCAGPPARSPDDVDRLEWAIAIHGGAGTISRSGDPALQQGYRDGLARALDTGKAILESGGKSLDAVEAVIRVLEDDPHFNAGRGAVFNHEGDNELDASIMDGATLACGGVAAVRTVKNPISLSRRVMEQTRHVLLFGAGAEAFAIEQGFEPVEQAYFHTERRWEQLQRALAGRGGALDVKGTVGAVALDRQGNLAAGTSTGGLTNKRYGRVGDSPIVGAGTYADNRTCAVSGTGRGEEFIRHGVAHSISAAIDVGGLSLEQAARRVVHETLQPGDGGVIAVSPRGEIVIEFNSEGMYRGVADANGRYEIRIWE